MYITKLQYLTGVSNVRNRQHISGVSFILYYCTNYKPLYLKTLMKSPNYLEKYCS